MAYVPRHFGGWEGLLDERSQILAGEYRSPRGEVRKRR